MTQKKEIQPAASSALSLLITILEIYFIITPVFMHRQLIATFGDRKEFLRVCCHASFSIEKKATKKKQKNKIRFSNALHFFTLRVSVVA